VSFIKIKYLYKNCKSYFYGYTDWNIRRWILAPPSGPSRAGIAIFYFVTFRKQYLLKHLIPSVEGDGEVDKHVTLACDNRNKQ